MTIKTKDWSAHIDGMPPGTWINVEGTVTVAHSGITPKLEMANACEPRLELKLESSNETSLQVETDKRVRYFAWGNYNSDFKFTSVSIFYEGKLLHHIDKITFTS
ncbi:MULTISPECIES: hypothetical protein [Pseudomonas]|uniref:Uncharacterized protein n=1 Tax=Pseudomonas monachiensis TaxID=3060212 RepID=A0ABW9H2M8_9PSED|nr:MULTISPECIES: hypothetical protein [unclassified Pseudomonas]KRA88714.1 hypothetical protein ASD91_14715 [Pseudomonas sp. Root68]KRB71847.1 hypothetical protein ASD95_00810 [Pseudomonas sp. Root71]